MHKITEQLLPLAVPIMSIKPDPMNARVGHALDDLARSLDAYGQVKPIVVNAKTKQIEAGNGTYSAAKNLGWTEIAAVMVDHDSSQAIEYAIADNRLTDLSHFDDEILLTLLQSLDSPLDVPGIDDAFMAELLESVGGQRYADKNKEINIDDIEDAMTITLKFTEEDYWKVKNGLSSIADTPEEAVLKLLGHE